MKIFKRKNGASLAPVVLLMAAIIFGAANFAQAAYLVKGQVTLDGLPADGAAVVLTNVSTGASLTDTVGAGGASGLSGFYSFDLDSLSASSTNGDEIRIEATINALGGSTSIIYDASVAPQTPSAINIVSPVTSYTITATSSANGTISPSGNVAVNAGASQEFTIIPDSGYVISDVLVDGVSVGTASSYNFINIIANHTIEASFGVVADTIAPVITLIGSSTMDAVLNSTYTDLGATAFDNVDGNISGNIIATSSINIGVLGQYIVTYTVSDLAGNAATPVVRTINVIEADITQPVISLNGSSPLNVILNSVFNDPGATAFDNVDGDLTAGIIATGTVDATALGQYAINYSVTDAANNTASTTRIVNVVTDIVPPVISLNGPNPMSLALNTAFNDPGASALDDIDGDVSSNILVSGEINAGVPGQYVITYTVADLAGNIASTTRIVNVTAEESPVTPTPNSGGGGGGGTPIEVLLGRDMVSPGIPTNVGIEKLNIGYRISWENPIDGDFQGVRIIRKNDSIPANVNDGLLIFENAGNSYTDTSADATSNYYYGIAAYDRFGNFSNLVVINVNGDEVIVLGDEFYIYSQYKSFDKLPSSLVEAISTEESRLIFGSQQSVSLSAANQRLFNRLISLDTTLTEAQKNVLANFIQNGSPTTTRLGSGERAGVVSSYFNAFGALPKSAEDYQAIIKIANGRWLSKKSAASENKAMETFRSVYKRNANLSNNLDSNAIMLMSYGLLPINKNIESERAAIAIFRNITKRNPASTSDWNMVRSIAYSGAKR